MRRVMERSLAPETGDLDDQVIDRVSAREQLTCTDDAAPSAVQVLGNITQWTTDIREAAVHLSVEGLYDLYVDVWPLTKKGSGAVRSAGVSGMRSASKHHSLVLCLLI